MITMMNNGTLNLWFNISVVQCEFYLLQYICVSPTMRTVPVRELGSQFAN